MKYVNSQDICDPLCKILTVSCGVTQIINKILEKQKAAIKETRCGIAPPIPTKRTKQNNNLFLMEKTVCESI